MIAAVNDTLLPPPWTTNTTASDNRISFSELFYMRSFARSSGDGEVEGRGAVERVSPNESPTLRRAG